MIKCVVFDLDHTLLNDTKEITPFTKEMLTKLLDMGIKISFASGRAEPLMKPYVEEMGLDTPILINNGALIKNFKTNHIYYESNLDMSAQNEILKDAIDNNLSFIFYADNTFYVSSNERAEFYKRWNNQNPNAYIHLEVNTDYAFLCQKTAYKLLLIIEDEETFNHYYQKYQNHPLAHITKSQDTFLDILSKGSNKGEGVKILAKILNIKTEEILAFGDNDNDAEMLKEVGLSIAMPNGSPKAIASATFVAPFTNQQEGVAKALELLINQGIISPLNEEKN